MRGGGGRLVASWFLVRGYVVVVDASGNGDDERH